MQPTINHTGSLTDELHHRLLGRPCKALPTTIAAEAITNKVVLEILFSFIYNGEEPLRWRAAWAIEKVCKQHPQLVLSERERMKSLAMQTDTPDGLRRLLLSILHQLPSDADLDVVFFNFLLDKMVDLQSPPGVQSLAMKLAYRQSKIDYDLSEEFLCIIQNMEQDFYSAGVKSVIRNCLRQKRRNA